MEQHDTGPARNAIVPPRPAPRPVRYAPALSPERWIAGAVGVGFLVSLAVLVYESSRSPVHLTLPAPSALPEGEATSSEWDVLIQRAVATQGESVPAMLSRQPAQQPAPAQPESSFPFPLTESTVAPQGDNAIVIKSVNAVPSRATVQSSAAGGPAAKVIEPAPACTAAVAALGLCPSSEPAIAQPVTQVGSSTDGARRPAKDDATHGCKAAVVALGLCTQ
jgi:hypothetical protein